MAQTLRVHASNGETSGRRLQHPNKVPASNTEQPNYSFKFASAAGDFFPDPYTRENGSSSTISSQNQGILDELEDFIQGPERLANNNNKRNSLPNKMATSNSSGTNQPTTNANGFQMPMNSTTGLSNKTGTVGLGMPSSVHLNNQLPSILDPGSVAANSAVSTRNLSQSNPNPANMKLLASNRPALSPQNQFNQYNTRQEMLFHGYRDVPIAPRAPNVAEQYGSQQRFMSAPNENDLRGLNVQTSSHFPHNYYTQDSHSSQSGQRVGNSQTDERSMITNQHFQWQNRLQTANHCSPNVASNTSPGQSINRTQMQPGIPQRQSPYMIGGSPQQQSQSVGQPQQQQPYGHQPYMMQAGIKGAGMPQSQQYYGNMGMGRPLITQPGLSGQTQPITNQMQKPPQDYATFQQQQMQQRYSQPPYPQQLQYISQQQQRQSQQHQPFPQAPSGMSRMPSSHPQPILPKPASAEMFAATSGVGYPNTVTDNVPGGQEFPPARMADQQLHQAPGLPPSSASYGNSPMGRVSASAEMMARYGSVPGAFQRSNPPAFPGSRHARHTASPNVTVGSPLRNMADSGSSLGASPVGVPSFSTESSTSSGSISSLYPPAKMPPPFGMAGNQMQAGPGVSNTNIPSVSGGGTVFPVSSPGLGPAAAAAAAVLEAVTSVSRYPGVTQTTGQSYIGSQEMMLASKTAETSALSSAQAPVMSSSGMPSLALRSLMENVHTGRVPSPTLNELPTAEDVEAMIESMRAGETTLSAEESEQPSQGSAPPSVGSLPTGGTVAPSPASSQAAQPACPPSDASNTTQESHQLTNSTLDLPAIDKDGTQLSPHSSPLSSFSGLSPGVSPSGVSITSSFGDGEVDLDEINPSLPSNPALPSYQFQSRGNQQQYEKFSRLYELSDEPERKDFLDKYQAFMSGQGTQVAQVPVLVRQPLDLFKFFTVVRERGGLQEVVRKKLWQEVLQALNLSADLPNVVDVLRNQYSRYLLSYEMKYSKSNLIGDIMKNNLLEGSGIPPPNATVTCSEVIIPTSTLTQSHRQGDANSISVFNSVPSESPANLGSSFSFNDVPSEGGYDASKLISDYRENTANFQVNPPPSSAFATPQYPYSGERRSSVPNHSHAGYPPYMSQRNLYPGAASLSQLFQQSSQQQQQQQQPQQPQPGHPPPNYQHSQVSQRASPSLMGPLSSSHHMMPGPSPQESMHPLWGSQYSPSTEPEHMFDYPPATHTGRVVRASGGPQSHFPPAPPYGSYPGRQQNQYSPSTPPYRPTTSPSPSSRQPVTQPLPPQKMKFPSQQTQIPQQQSQVSSLKRELPFPGDAVESTRPVFTKKRKLTSRDLGPVEAWRVMMSLKSGLLSEATWALDTLNILLYDDNTVAYFMLSQLPGLLDNLIDHFRRYLIEIFGIFTENEISVGSFVFDKPEQETPVCEKEKESDDVKKRNRDAKRSFTSVVVGSTFRFPREGFQSGSSDWLMGGGDTTRHIQTHLGTLSTCDGMTERKLEESEIEEEESLQSTASCKQSQEEEDSEETKLSEINRKKCEMPCNHTTHCLNGTKCDLNWINLQNDLSRSPLSEEEKSTTDVVVKKEGTKVETNDGELNSAKNDLCVVKTREDKFTARLKEEMDLDLDSEDEDTESDSYLKSELVQKIDLKQDSIIEEQSCGKEDAPLCLRSECQDAVSRRCLCVSNILRGLSFVPGNDAEMSRHAGLLLIVGRLLMLHHKHAKRVPYRHSYIQDDIELDCPSNDREDWWWYCLEGLRENALVITANVAGQLDLSLYPEAISLPLLDGLLHWFVCKSAAAQDPMPTATPGTSLSPRQLVLESLAKMSILESNVDMILTTPPLSRVDQLYAMLVRLVGEKGNPVTRELALVLLSNLAQGENSFVGFGDSKACISMLLEFIEDAASSMSAYASGGALAQAGFHSENFCGTSVDMLRRAASTLVCLARIRTNRALFLPYQERILRVATLRVLDNMITNHLAEILFYLSR